MSARLSARLSVCLSARPSHLFDYVSIIVSSWTFQELLTMTNVMSKHKVKIIFNLSYVGNGCSVHRLPLCNHLF